jgi:hypothetical protein
MAGLGTTHLVLGRVLGVLQCKAYVNNECMKTILDLGRLVVQSLVVCKLILTVSGAVTKLLSRG